MNSIFVDMSHETNIKSVLFITSDLEYVQRVKNISNENLNISFFDETRFQLLNNSINSFDIIVFDNDKNNLEKFVQTFKTIQSFDLNIPLIILESKLSNDSSLYKYSNGFLVLEKPVKENVLLANIELCINFLNNNKRKQFEEGFYFDMNRELLFKGKELIKLTKTERNLIKLLAENSNMLVTYEEISEIVWKGKSFSIFSLRNVVKHIREKTSETFIKNSSNRGYVITTI